MESMEDDMMELEETVLFLDRIENTFVCIVDERIVKVHALEQFTYFIFRFEPVRVVDARYFGLGWGKHDAFNPHVGAFDILACLFDVGQIIHKNGDFVTFA